MDDQPNDLFTVEKSFAYAGRHLLIDCWNASELTNIKVIEQTLRDAVTATSDTLLHINLHQVNPNGGISGVAVMARSHISIHTLPERDYAAIDVLGCGDNFPEHTIPIFKQAFRTENIDVSEHLRGRQFTDLSPRCTEERMENAEI